jgi:hypothetical protein
VAKSRHTNRATGAFATSNNAKPEDADSFLGAANALSAG